MLGDNIKALRTNKNMYQQDLADTLSVSKSTIAMWETNKRIPDATTLLKIANYFNISVDELLGNTLPNSEPSLTTSPEYRGFNILDKENIYMIPIFRTVSASLRAGPWKRLFCLPGVSWRRYRGNCLLFCCRDSSGIFSGIFSHSRTYVLYISPYQVFL